MSIPIREFKAHLSRYLAKVRAGQTLEISSHRKVIARVTAVPDKAASGIERLVQSGDARWKGGKPTGAEIRLVESGKPVSALVQEDRG